MSGRVWIVLIAGLACAADAPEDPAIALARILAGKGTISSAELTSVESASPGGRVSALASILERKGVLTAAEVAQFRGAPPPTVAAVKAPATGPAQAPELPVTSRGPKVSLYGTLLVNAVYNTAASSIEDLPLFASKQGSDATSADKNFAMTARQTRLGLRFQQDNVAGARLSGQFEFDLFGGKTPLGNGIDMDIFRLRLAYGRLDWKHAAFEAGQDWGIFAPLNPTSLAMFAIPEFAASGNPWIRLPQIRGEFTASHLLWQVAALDPNMGDYPTSSFSTSRQPGIGERGRMPSVETRVAWSDAALGQKLTLGLSGHYGRGKNYTTVDNVTRFAPVDSWGVALDYTVPLAHFFNLSGEAFEGRALGIYSAASGEAIGAVGTPGAHGVETRGGWTQAQFNFTRQWQMNLAYGIEVPNASQLPVGNRSRNQSYMGNVMFKLSPNITFAWEFRRMLTDYRNQMFANERGNHVNLAIGYTF